MSALWSSLLSSLSLLLWVMMQSACSLEGADATGIVPDAGAGGDAVVDDGGTQAMVCSNMVGTAAEIAATPRTDENLEFLALHLRSSNGITADQDVYERVVADIRAARKVLPPDFVAISYRTHEQGQDLFLMFSEDATKRIEEGRYEAWKCLNDFYGVRSMMTEYFPVTDSTSVTLTFKGIYRIESLVPLYRGLPDVEYVSTNPSGGDGSTICAKIGGDTYEYVFDLAGGDCPRGCTTHDARYFTSSAPGVMVGSGHWIGGSNAPDWFSRICMGSTP